MQQASRKSIINPKAGNPPDASSDPIFAAIASHQALDHTWRDMAAALDGAEPSGLRSRAYAECRGFTDADVDTAVAAAEQAAWEMAQIIPATVAGTAALLSYITNGLFEIGEFRWHEIAFGNVARSLERMTSRAA